MQHCDPEYLALRALGETPSSAADAEHLLGCARCRAELDQLAAVVATGRTITPEDVPVPPPPEVWERVASTLGLPDGLRPFVPRAEADERVARARRSGRRGMAIVGAAAVVVGLLGGVAVTGAVRGTPATTTPDVVARAQLDPLKVPGMAGQVALERSTGGEQLSVDVSGVPAQARTSGFLEVWLLDPASGRMISLGALNDADRGTFVVPPGVDVRQYATVDVSLEPRDGNPGHAKNSMLRATLGV